MKKIIATIITATTLLMAMTMNVSADELNEVTKPADSDSASGTVELYATKASAYTVKLPISVDVSANSTTFKVYAKGDIDAAKKLKVDKGTSTAYELVDDANEKENVALTIDVDKAFAYDDLAADYNNDVYITFTITHDDFLAGSYSFDLPIAISLVDAEA